MKSKQVRPFLQHSRATTVGIPYQAVGQALWSTDPKATHRIWQLSPLAAT